jgi:hypothetical protein
MGPRLDLDLDTSGRVHTPDPWVFLSSFGTCSMILNLKVVWAYQYACLACPTTKVLPILAIKEFYNYTKFENKNIPHFKFITEIYYDHRWRWQLGHVCKLVPRTGRQWLWPRAAHNQQ